MTDTILPEPRSYEQAQARLEAIAALLDHPEVPLAEELALCAEAAALIRLCRELLTEAEGKLEQLVEAAGSGVRLESIQGSGFRVQE